MHFFLALLLDGLLAGAVYALIALAFVVVYKATRMINFAVGDWIGFAARLVAVGANGAGLGLIGGLLVATAGMALLGLAFSLAVLRRLIGRPMIALLMVSLGAGAVLRAGGMTFLTQSPSELRLSLPDANLMLGPIAVAGDKLATALLALGGVVAVAWFFRRTRTGLALRAIADDAQAAAAAGIDLERHLAIVWLAMALVSVAAGALWVQVSGGGIGMVLVGLKIFPIVIIGGLDSIRGSFVGALLIGVTESLAGGYLDPLLGSGSGTMSSYLLLIAMLWLRPTGLFGQRIVERV